MKKTLSIVLALVMVLGLLAACSSGDGDTPAVTSSAPTPSDGGAEASQDPNGEEESITKEMLENSKPGEYVVEKVAAGMEVTLAYIGYVDNEAIMEVFAGGVKEVCDELGVNFVKTHANGDVANQISQIENYITMQVAAICLVPPDADTIRDAVMDAQNNGITVVLYGVTGGGDYSISTRIDNAAQGAEIGKMCVAWAKQRYPDAGENEIKAAVFGTYAIDEQRKKTDAMVAQIEAAPNMELTFFTDGLQDNIESGFNTMQDALTYDSNIKVFAVISYLASMGAQNYIMAQPGLNYDEYCVFTGGLDSTLDDMLAASSEGNGVLRGSVAPMGTSAYYLGLACREALLGEISAPFERLFEFEYKTEANFVYPG